LEVKRDLGVCPQTAAGVRCGGEWVSSLNSRRHTMRRFTKCLILSAVLTGCESVTDPTSDTTAAGFESRTSVSQATAGSLALETAPSDGNGNKLVLTFEDNFPADCPSGDVLDGHLEGWVQVRTSDQPDNPNVRLEVFHALITFNNAAGETYGFHDVGPNHYYVQNGILFIAISGTGPAA
jgi:hypothetical protein